MRERNVMDFKRLAWIGVLLVALVGSGSNCLEKKVIDVVVNETTYAVFNENHTSVQFSTSVTVDYAEEIEDILAEQGYGLGDIDTARVQGATYEVLEFLNDHDWIIGGSICVQREDQAGGEVVLISYSSESLNALIGNPKAAALTNAGVQLLNEALADFLAGGHPVLKFTVKNDSVTGGTVSAEDPLIFTWQACVVFEIIFEQTLDVPSSPI